MRVCGPQLCAEYYAPNFYTDTATALRSSTRATVDEVANDIETLWFKQMEWPLLMAQIALTQSLFFLSKSPFLRTLRSTVTILKIRYFFLILLWLPVRPILNKSTRICIMAWRRTSDKPLPKPMSTKMSDDLCRDQTIISQAHKKTIMIGPCCWSSTMRWNHMISVYPHRGVINVTRGVMGFNHHGYRFSSRGHDPKCTWWENRWISINHRTYECLVIKASVKRDI